MKKCDCNKLKSKLKLEMKGFWQWMWPRQGLQTPKRRINTNKRCLTINSYKMILVLLNLLEGFKLHILCKDEELATIYLIKHLNKVTCWKLLISILNLTRKETYLKIDCTPKLASTKLDSQRNKQCTITKWETTQTRLLGSITILL